MAIGDQIKTENILKLNELINFVNNNDHNQDSLDIKSYIENFKENSDLIHSCYTLGITDLKMSDFLEITHALIHKCSVAVAEKESVISAESLNSFLMNSTQLVSLFENLAVESKMQFEIDQIMELYLSVFENCSLIILEKQYSLNSHEDELFKLMENLDSHENSSFSQYFFDKLKVIKNSNLNDDLNRNPPPTQEAIIDEKSPQGFNVLYRMLGIEVPIIASLDMDKMNDEDIAIEKDIAISKNLPADQEVVSPDMGNYNGTIINTIDQAYSTINMSDLTQVVLKTNDIEFKEEDVSNQSLISITDVPSISSTNKKKSKHNKKSKVKKLEPAENSEPPLSANLETPKDSIASKNDIPPLKKTKQTELREKLRQKIKAKKSNNSEERTSKFYEEETDSSKTKYPAKENSDKPASDDYSLKKIEADKSRLIYEDLKNAIDVSNDQYDSHDLHKLLQNTSLEQLMKASFFFDKELCALYDAFVIDVNSPNTFPDLSGSTHSESPLAYAADKGKQFAIELLVDVKWSSKQFSTALLYAMISNHPETNEFLLNKFIEILKKTSPSLESNDAISGIDNPFINAVKRQSFKDVKLILDIVEKESKELLKILFLSQDSRSGKSLLMFCAENGNLEGIKFFLDFNKQHNLVSEIELLNIKDDCNKSVLIYAIEFNKKNNIASNNKDNCATFIIEKLHNAPNNSSYKPKEKQQDTFKEQQKIKIGGHVFNVEKIDKEEFNNQANVSIHLSKNFDSLDDVLQTVSQSVMNFFSSDSISVMLDDSSNLTGDSLDLN